MYIVGFMNILNFLLIMAIIDGGEHNGFLKEMCEYSNEVFLW